MYTPCIPAGRLLAAANSDGATPVGAHWYTAGRGGCPSGGRLDGRYVCTQYRQRGYHRWREKKQKGKQKVTAAASSTQPLTIITASNGPSSRAPRPCPKHHQPRRPLSPPNTARQTARAEVAALVLMGRPHLGRLHRVPARRGRRRGRRRGHRRGGFATRRRALGRLGAAAGGGRGEAATPAAA